jgi:hypothetical protein
MEQIAKDPWGNDYWFALVTELKSLDIFLGFLI